MANEGWWKQLPLRKYHYFVDGKSLCQKHTIPVGTRTWLPSELGRCAICNSFSRVARRELADRLLEANEQEQKDKEQ